MTHVTVTRCVMSDQGTFGVLTIDDDPLPTCFTCERPWKNNQRKISCIPAGTYQCIAFKSPKHGNVWLLKNVSDRDMIEIHAANRPSELEGCLAPGRSFTTFHDIPGGKSEPGVAQSKLTMELLRARLPDKFTLTIQQP